MRLLLGYDGSSCSDQAVRSLARAGLPVTGEVLVLSADERPSRDLSGSTADSSGKLSAREISQRGAAVVAAALPAWSISAESQEGNAPADALLSVAAEWKADLIVVGSHGRRGLRRLVLGSVAGHVVRHAGCSVRVGRCVTAPRSSRRVPPRILVAVDGSCGSESALRAVAARSWPVGTELLVLSVIDTRMLLLAGECPVIDVPELSGDEDETTFERRAALDAAEFLGAIGLPAQPKVVTGDPVQALLAEAREIGAECIFVGATGLQRLEAFLLGRIPGTLAEQAACSVEVIRAPSAAQVRTDSAAVHPFARVTP